MAVKVKVNKKLTKDVGKFVDMITGRNAYIEKQQAKEVTADYPINIAAKEMHPDCQLMVIDEIIDHEGAGAKSYIFKRKDGKPAAMFRAGQYTSVLLEIEGSVITRPYSISSSPKWTKEGKMAITVKANPGGYAAEWILSNWKIGDEVKLTGGEGQFYYDSLRDEKNVTALAGGSGITPFLSMAYAIRDGYEDFNLTIIFGSKNEKSILFKNELKAIAKECDKVKVINVLSNQKKKGYENGFITAELIEKYSEGDYSIFICGPEAMYNFLDGEIAKLNKPKRQIRREMLGVTKKVWEKEGYPAEAKGKTFKLKINQCGNAYEIEANADEPILCAIERAGINAPSRCRSGECGWCRSKLVSGEVYCPEENEYRRWADKENGYIHPCCTFPLSDIELEVPGTYLK